MPKVDKNYKNWFTQAWMESGGLITPAVAANILNIDRSQITRRIKSGKVKCWRYEKLSPLVSLNDIIKEANSKATI